MTKETAKATAVVAISAASVLGAWLTGDSNAMWGLLAAVVIAVNW